MKMNTIMNMMKIKRLFVFVVILVNVFSFSCFADTKTDIEAEYENIKKQIESLTGESNVQIELENMIEQAEGETNGGNLENARDIIDSVKAKVESMSNGNQNAEDKPMFEPVLSQLAEIFSAPENTETIETAETTETAETGEIPESGVKRFVSEFKNALESHKESDDNIITLMLVSMLALAAGISAKTLGNYKKFKPIQRINGKKSMFDFGDISYDFKNDFQHFDFADQNFHMQMVQDNLNQQFMQQSMDFVMNEAMKAVTPFDMGGYVQGPGFNPSDTMAHNAMNDMNNMNNMGGGMF